MKMVRKDAWPLSGEEGLEEIREMIADGTVPPAGGAARHGDDARTCSTPTSST